MKISTLVLLTLLIQSAHAELNLQPTEISREVAGFPFKLLQFSDDNNSVTYEPPTGWTYISRGSSVMILRPPDNSTAEAKIEVVKDATPLVFDEEHMPTLAAMAKALVPPGGELVGEPTVLAGRASFDNRPSCYIQTTYLFYGSKHTHSQLLVENGQTKLKFGLISPAEKFEKFQAEFTRSWASWQWLIADRAASN
ncbi:MAG: hypothetical protein ABR526_12695 [Chthoniobacterales bacterium]